MNTIVYVTINIHTYSFYVGITNNRRKGYLGSGVAFNDALKKYGRKSFRRFTLEICKDRIEASLREKYWIERTKLKWSNRKCLNLTDGGENQYTVLPEISKKTSEKLKKYYKDRPELRAEYRERALKNLVPYVKKHGVANKIITPEIAKYISEQYDNYKKSLVELSKELNVHISTVANYVNLKKKCNGSGNGKSKLIEPQVIEIRELHSKGKYLQREIAEMYGVHQKLISRIVNRKIWLHI